MADSRISGVSYDEYGRPMPPTFRTPQDFVAYVDRLGDGATPGARKQADEIRRNPSAWEMSGGHPKKKDDFLARHVQKIGLGVVGGAIAAPYVASLFGGGGGATASAAGGGASGVLPSSSLPVGSLMGGPVGISSQGVSAGVGAGAGATDFLGAAPSAGRRIANGLSDIGANSAADAVQATLAWLASRNAGQPSDEEKAYLEQLRQMQALSQKRIEYQNPLYQAVSQLAMSRLPAGVQQPMGELK